MMPATQRIELQMAADVVPVVRDIFAGFIDAKIHSAVQSAVAHERFLASITERRHIAAAVARQREADAKLCDPDGSEALEAVRLALVGVARAIRRGA